MCGFSLQEERILFSDHIYGSSFLFCLLTLLSPTPYSLILHLTDTGGFFFLISFSKKKRCNKPVVQKSWCQRFILCHFKCFSISISISAGSLLAAQFPGPWQRWMWRQRSCSERSRGEDEQLLRVSSLHKTKERALQLPGKRQHFSA